MAKRMLADSGGHSVFVELSAADRNKLIMEREIPILCADIAALVGKPFTIIWDPREETASTDCKAIIKMSPCPFLEGRPHIGRGTGYHEAGHIRFSSYGGRLLRRAHKEGGESLFHIMNIILDRKDDILTAEYAPGFAKILRQRLSYICTMSKREVYKEKIAKLGITDEAEIMKFLRCLPTQDLYEDFFYAAKWHRRPRMQKTFKAMKYLRRSVLLTASPDKLLWIAKRIHEILGENRVAKTRFIGLALIAIAFGLGLTIKADKNFLAQINALMNKYVSGQRQKALKAMVEALKGVGVVYPGPVSVGLAGKVPVKRVAADVRYSIAYKAILREISHLAERTKQALKRLDTPSEFELVGQDEGELDLSQVARIAAGLSGYRKEIVKERDLDACIHLCLDTSGSMAGDKVAKAKQLCVLFTEAIAGMKGMVDGNIWTFDSTEIIDYGPVSANSGFTAAVGRASNSDSQMIPIVASVLAKSRRRRKLMLVFCDNGPDDIETVKRLTSQLKSRGILAIHFLFEVHGSPQIYPIELLYGSLDECVQEFGDVLKLIISNLK